MSTDYLIIGGGIYGVGTAWELAKHGEDVTVLEADTIGSGASGGLGKRGVRANGRDPRELELARRAYDLWPHLDEIIGGIGYDRTGHLLLYEQSLPRTGGGYPSATARARIQNTLGVETHLLDATDVREMEPNCSDGVLGALYCPNDGIADHTATTRGLATAAEALGATIHEDTRVTEIGIEGTRVAGVVTQDGREFPVTNHVLLAANYGTVELLESAFDIELPVYKRYPQVMATEPVEGRPVRHLIGHDNRRLAVKMLPDSRVMISGGWSGDARSGKAETVPAQVHGNMQAAREVFPCLDDVDIAAADASRAETISVDAIPIIDRPQSVENLVFATGWSGHGFAISPAINERLTDWLRTGSRPALLDPFTHDRFTPTHP